jgi:hypothetical protein
LADAPCQVLADGGDTAAFVLGFVRARLSDDGILWAHVPCALLLTVTVAWVTAWSFSRASRRS